MQCFGGEGPREGGLSGRVFVLEHDRPERADDYKGVRQADHEEQRPDPIQTKTVAFARRILHRCVGNHVTRLDRKLETIDMFRISDRNGDAHRPIIDDGLGHRQIQETDRYVVRVGKV